MKKKRSLTENMKKSRNDAPALKSIITKTGFRHSDIVINKELKAYIPPLKDEELRLLEENIIKEGVRDPLIFWDKGNEKVLIDGHNRYGIIERNNIQSYPTEFKTFQNIEEVKDWMINHQLGRRNLTKNQIGYLRGVQYNREKKSSVDNLKNQQKGSTYQNDKSGDWTIKRLAEEHKVSTATISRDANYAKGVDLIGEKYPKTKQEIIAGNAKLKKTDIQGVGSGKNSVTELFENIKKKDIKSLEPKPKERVEYHRKKIEYHVKRLRAMGVDEKSLKLILKSM